MTSPTVLCDNPDHTRRVRAAARLTWPDGEFNTVTACMGDMQCKIAEARDNGIALTIELFAAPACCEEAPSFTEQHADPSLIGVNPRGAS